MFKNLIAIVGIVGMVAGCSQDVDGAVEAEPEAGMVDEAQTFGVREFAKPNGQLVDVGPNDVTFYIVGTCTAKNYIGLDACFANIVASCKDAGGVGLAARLTGQPNAVGRYNISGKCVVRGEAPEES
jgi:hypothetical protein